MYKCFEGYEGLPSLTLFLLEPSLLLYVLFDSAVLYCPKRASFLLVGVLASGPPSEIQWGNGKESF